MFFMNNSKPPKTALVPYLKSCVEMCLTTMSVSVPNSVFEYIMMSHRCYGVLTTNYKLIEYVHRYMFPDANKLCQRFVVYRIPFLDFSPAR